MEMERCIRVRAYAMRALVNEVEEFGTANCRSEAVEELRSRLSRIAGVTDNWVLSGVFCLAPLWTPERVVTTARCLVNDAVNR